MVWFVFAVIALIVGVLLFIKARYKFFGFVSVFLMLVFLTFSCVYTQDIGEVAVLRNITGSVAGSTENPGIHIKAPWQEIIKYDTRNNVISFIGDGTEDYFGGSANGPKVTVNDSGGAQANIDIQVNYSIDPSIAEDLYANYGTQESFVQKVVAVDVRAIPREVAGQFNTIDILTNRGEFTRAVQDALIEKWEPLGLHVEQVTIQQVVYPESITNKYADAQVAEVAQQEAQARQETARIEAETKVIQAEAEAEANNVLAESLSDEILQQRYIDALSELGNSGNLVVITDGSSTPLIDVNPSNQNN